MPNGQAQLTLDISNKIYDPLRVGTLATVREASLSGIANRYIDLRLGPAQGAPIPDGGTIPTQDTTSEVDLDELFNTLNAPTLKGLQSVIQGSASQYAGAGKAAQAAWQYLNPAVASTSVLFSEINRDTNKFTDFIVKTQQPRLRRRPAPVRSERAWSRTWTTTTSALAAQHTALGQSIQRAALDSWGWRTRRS